MVLSSVQDVMVWATGGGELVLLKAQKLMFVLAKASVDTRALTEGMMPKRPVLLAEKVLMVDEGPKRLGGRAPEMRGLS